MALGAGVRRRGAVLGGDIDLDGHGYSVLGLGVRGGGGDVVVFEGHDVACDEAESALTLRDLDANEDVEDHC